MKCKVICKQLGEETNIRHKPTTIRWVLTTWGWGGTVPRAAQASSCRCIYWFPNGGQKTGLRDIVKQPTLGNPEDVLRKQVT